MSSIFVFNFLNTIKYSIATFQILFSSYIMISYLILFVSNSLPSFLLIFLESILFSSVLPRFLYLHLLLSVKDLSPIVDSLCRQLGIILCIRATGKEKEGEEVEISKFEKSSKDVKKILLPPTIIFFFVIIHKFLKKKLLLIS